MTINPEGRASRGLAKAAPVEEIWLMTTSTGLGGVLTTARREGLCAGLVKPYWPRGERPRRGTKNGVLARGWPRGP